jgi:hypothetical protein
VQTWGESTRKGDTLFLHVFNWPADGRLVVGGLKSDVKSAALLAGGAALKVTRLNTTDISIAVPATAPDKVDSVVVLQCQGEPQADAARLLQPEFSSEVLRAFDGELHGKGLKYGPGKKTDDVVMNWTKPEESISWPVRLEKPAAYEVFANYTAPADSAGGKFAVSLGDKKLSAEVKAGSDVNLSLGQVTLAPGKFDIKISADTIAGGELLRLRRLELKPFVAH